MVACRVGIGLLNLVSQHRIMTLACGGQRIAGRLRSHVQCFRGAGNPGVRNHCRGLVAGDSGRVCRFHAANAAPAGGRVEKRQNAMDRSAKRTGRAAPGDRAIGRAARPQGIREYANRGGGVSRCRGVPGARRLCNIPLYLFPQFLRALARAFAGKLTQPPDEAFNREMVVCHFMGTFAGLWQTRQTERSFQP